MEYKTHHSCIRITKLQEELAFYKDAIGFTTQSIVQHTINIVSYFIGKKSGCVLQLLVAPGNTAEHAGYGHFAVETDDIQASFTRHETMGIVTGPITEQPHQFGYFIRDPEGYETEIVQLKR